MTRRFWSPSDVAYLQAHYADTSTAAIAARLKWGLRAVYSKAKLLGLRKSAAYLQNPANRCRLLRGSQIGKSTQFKRGHTPANKDVRRPGYAPGRMAETQYKPGVRAGIAARNWRPIGTILPDADGYLRIKVREAKYGKEATGYGNTKVWPMYNRYLWEQEHGPIPPQHLIVFRDGNRSNCVLENLECISMAKNARRNQMWNSLPRPLAEAIQANGALKRKIRGFERGQKQNQ